MWHNSVHASCLLSVVVPHFHIKRNLITFRKFKQLYRQFWFPSPASPPYKHICQIGDPVLRRKAELVNVEDIKKKDIQMVLKKMHEVMQLYGSVGISAPQIGVPLRIFAVQFTKKMTNEYSPDILKVRQMSVVPFKVFINPEMKVIDYEKVHFPEACESVRGFSADVPRYREVLVNGNYYFI
ncbi:hypothetical protein C0J52_24712 [Blattella germanica]|nr:hypothetical protein C0J52_24712 [Blattella germanica]